MQYGALRAAVATYAALLMAPLGTVLIRPSVPVFLAGCVVGGVAGIAVTGRVDASEWLAGWRLVGVAVLPGGWIGALAVSLPPTGGVPWYRILGGLAAIPGVVAIGLAYHIRTGRRLDGATTHVTFTARPAPGVRRQLKLAGSTLLAASLVIGVGLPLVSGESASLTTFVWVPALLPVWIAVLTDGDGREVAVTGEGLRVQRALHDWDGFTGYERTDDELALYRGGWYRPKFSFDVEDIDDADAVVEELDRYLQTRH